MSSVKVAFGSSRTDVGLRGGGIRAHILSRTLPLVVGVFALVVGVAVLMSTSAQKALAIREAAAIAREQANAFDSQMNAHLGIARTLASVMESYSSASREEVHAMLRGLLDEYPDILGSYVGFEPDAFDGRDSQYANAPGHDDTGRFIPYWNRLKGPIQLDPLMDYETSDYYQVPKRTKAEAIIEPYLYEGVLMTSYVAPILREGKFQGIAGVDVSLAAIDKVISDIRVFESGYAFLVSNSGIFVSYPDKDFIGNKTLLQLAEEKGSDALKVMAEAIKEGKEGRVEAADPVTGKPALLFYAPVKTGKWGLVVVAPMAEALASVNRMRNVVLGISLVAVIATALLLLAIANGIANPLRLLARQAEALAKGDLTEDGNGEVKRISRRSDELGLLGRAFQRMVEASEEMAAAAERIASYDLTADVQPRSDKDVLGKALATMIENLRGIVAEIREGALSVAQSSEQLAETAQSSGQATQQVARTIEEVARGSSQTAESVSEATKGVEELVRSIDSIARGSQEAAGAVSVMSSSASMVAEAAALIDQQARAAREQASSSTTVASEGLSAVRTTVASIEDIASAVQEVARRVQEMGERSQQIGRIVSTIEDIAGQTNLLALNAQIEAARAGEQGRGFAVVADEVRKLAERAARATQEIAELIRSVQEGAQQAVQAMASGSERVRQGVELAGKSQEVIQRLQAAAQAVASQVERIEEAGRNLMQASQRMMQEVERVSAVVEETSASAEQMSASSAQVSQSLSSVAAVAEEASASAEEVSAAAEELSAQVEEVTAVAASLAEQAEAMRRAVGRFRTGEGQELERPAASRQASRKEPAIKQRQAVAALDGDGRR
jgi:methyl-accepting chemotaxis protein